MKKFRFTVKVSAIAAFTLAFATIVQAQATRTWVSGVGDDVNPCSRNAPCKTFAGAISKTAIGGEINALDPGGFGAVTITKSITIDGGGGVIAGVLAAFVTGINVSAGATGVVTLRNLDINGVGSGINGVQINSAKAVHIEHCNIYGFTQKGINDNLTTATTGAAELYVNDSFIRSNAQGIAITGTAAATEAFIDHCHIEGNNGFAVAASNGNFVSVTRSTISRNNGEGVKIDTNASANVTSCILVGNLTGILDNGVQLLLSDTTVSSNATGVSGAVTTFGNNNVRGNGGGNTLPAPVGQQ